MNVLKELRKVNEQRSIEGFKMELKDWNLPTWSNAVAGEVGEMCNIVKKIHRGDFKNGDQAVVKKSLAHEMADVVIYLDLMAKREGIDLEAAIVEKFNKVSDRVGSSLKL